MLEDPHAEIDRELTRLRRDLRWLTILAALFVLLHALLIPLLPRLFAHAPEVGVGALVLGVVTVALLITRGCRA